MLARVVPDCPSLLAPLDSSTAGRQFNDRVDWTDTLHQAFKSAQDKLHSNRTIALPRPEDELWIVTDGSVKESGIGATMYAMQEGKLKRSGFFSAKLGGRRVTWLPCEIQALSIAEAIRHLSPYIVQSHHKALVLTESKSCVQAYEKLCRGKFSVSPRVSTFLSVVSRYQASVRHLSGSANVSSDFTSRNAPTCTDQRCQICTFTKRMEDSVVQRITTADITSGKYALPFCSRSAWLAIQSNCPDMRRIQAHLRQGTRPSKKKQNARYVKRYLHVATVAHDGLLVVRRNDPFSHARDCIIVPPPVLDGLITALHIQLDHPSTHQLRQVRHRYLYALDLDKAIETITHGCHHCASLRNVPHTVAPQSTNDPPDAPA